MATRSKPRLAQDSYLALVRAHERVASGAAALLKGHGLSMTTYNVLRILRGAGPDGLPCHAVGERLVNRVRDVTRLLDRMERDGLVRRERSAADRRVVLAHLTAEGRSRVDALDDPVLDLHAAQFARLNASELGRLLAVLDRIAPEATSAR